MPIKLKKELRADALIYAVSGKVTSSDALTISKNIQKDAPKKFTRLVIDLSAIDYIDSHWLGVFIYSWKLLRDRGKELVFLIPSGFIRNLFLASNLGRAFTIIDSREQLDHPSPGTVPPPS